MRKARDKKTTGKSRPHAHSGLDSHKWATKMELRRLLSGKPDLRIKADVKASK